MELIKHYHWLFDTATYLFAALLFHFVFAWAYRYFLPKLEQTKQIWDDALLVALRPPLLFFIWLSVGFFSIASLSKHFSVLPQVVVNLPLIQHVGFLLALYWFVLRLIKTSERRIYDTAKLHERISDMTVRAFVQTARLIAFVIFLLYALRLFGLDISALLAFGGVGALAVGLAAKETLSNLLGGAMLYFDQPFTIGDSICSPDRNIEGTVEHIGLRKTRIRTFSKRLLYVPNSVFTSVSIENRSRMSHRRIKQFVGVRYDDAGKLRDIVREVEKMLRAHPEIDATETLMVRVTEFAASSINFMVYAFTKTTDWPKFQEVQEDVLLKVFDIILAHGAECAFPTRTLVSAEPLLKSGKLPAAEKPV